MKRALVFLLSCALLAGCGGGGGGNNGGGGTPPTPPPVPVGQQAAYASFGLSVLKSGQALSGGAAGSNGQVFQSVARRIGQGIRTGAPLAKSSRVHPMTQPTPPSMGPCTNQSEVGYSPAPPATPTQVWVYTFYDSACSQPYSQSYYQISSTSTSQSTTTVYDGSVQYLNNLLPPSVQSFSNSNITVVSTTTGGVQSFVQTLDTNPTQSQEGPSQTGAACGYTGGTPSTCGFGNVNHVLSLPGDLGMTINLSSFAVGSLPGNGVSYTLNGTVTSYSGGYSALSVGPNSSSFPNWTVSGGTAGATASLSATFDYNAAGIPNGGSLTATDSSHGVVVKVTINSDGSMSGTVATTGGKGIATFSVDVFGNGTMNFSNGSTASIQAFGLI